SCNNLDEVSPAHVTISPKDKDYARAASISDRETAVREGECPLWVISGHMHRKKPCPLYPRKRHQMRRLECPLSPIADICVREGPPPCSKRFLSRRQVRALSQQRLGLL